MIDEIGLQQPAWKELTTTESALGFASMGKPLTMPTGACSSSTGGDVAPRVRDAAHDPERLSNDIPRPNTRRPWGVQFLRVSCWRLRSGGRMMVWSGLIDTEGVGQ